MNLDFVCRFRRYYRDNAHEIWAANVRYSDEFTSTDTVVIRWNGENPKVLLLTNSVKRMNSSEYYELITDLFEDLTGGEGTFCFEVAFVTDPSDYYPDELTKIASMVFEEE